MKISILTMAEETFTSFLKTPLIERSLSSGSLEIEFIDFRDHVKGSFRKIDDAPYGGGPGMVIRCEPIVNALGSIRKEDSHVVIFTPYGRHFKQADAHRYAQYEHLILVCGHYEGFDQRIYDYADELVSLGDFILNGGEIAAMAVTEATARLLQGSLKAESIAEESFENGILEYPQYTKPREYAGRKVPEILFSGDHEAIRQWREAEALKLTAKYRPDLLDKSPAINAKKNTKKTNK